MAGNEPRMTTPVTAAGLRQYDHLPPEHAVRAAWVTPGPRPDWHRRAQDAIFEAMPLLGRALERLARQPPPPTPPTPMPPAEQAALLWRATDGCWWYAQQEPDPHRRALLEQQAAGLALAAQLVVHPGKILDVVPPHLRTPAEMEAAARRAGSGDGVAHPHPGPGPGRQHGPGEDAHDRVAGQPPVQCADGQLGDRRAHG